jgi:hypothetical protein
MFPYKPVGFQPQGRNNSRIMLADFQYNEDKKSFEAVNVVNANDVK